MHEAALSCGVYVVSAEYMNSTCPHVREKYFIQHVVKATRTSTPEN